MEPVGLAVGTFGLASTFSACMECFEYVEIGRNFGGDYGKCLLRLDTARLRIARWGAAIGLTSGEEKRNGSENDMSSEESRVAHDLLEHIKDSFDRAERFSDSYKRNALALKRSRTEDLQAFTSGTDLAPADKRTHITMHELAKMRQRSVPLSRKTKWALYEKSRFDSLISDVDDFVDRLVDLVPASLGRQAAMCKMDVEHFDDTRYLILLKDICGGDDKMLKEAVQARLKATGHTFNDFEAEDDAKYHLGDRNFGVEPRNHIANRFRLRGQAEVWIGNENHRA